MESINKLFGFTNGQDFDLDFFELCKRSKNLTFDTEYLSAKEMPFLQTPFKEIRRVDNRYLAGTYKWTRTYDEYLNALLKEFERVIKGIDPKEKYLFSCSSGSDSRIILGTMIKLQKEGYKFDNVHFLTWVGTEVDSFKALMKRGGWTNYTILDDKGENPYQLGDPKLPVQGWHSYTNQMKWWKDFNPKEYILLSGAMGEIIQWDFERWYYTGTWFFTRGEIIHRMQKTFKGVLFPMIDEGVLQMACASPKEWKGIGDHRSGRDKTRTDLCEKLGLIDIPFANCVYNFGLTERVKAEMMEQYYMSSFYKDYKHDVNLFPDNLILGHGAKCWGFGVTIYDKL